jgi:hypothetical protein
LSRRRRRRWRPFGQQEVVDHRHAGRPGRAEDFVLFAVEEPEFQARGARWRGQRREEGDGFL